MIQGIQDVSVSGYVDASPAIDPHRFRATVSRLARCRVGGRRLKAKGAAMRSRIAVLPRVPDRICLPVGRTG